MQIKARTIKNAIIQYQRDIITVKNVSIQKNHIKIN